MRRDSSITWGLHKMRRPHRRATFANQDTQLRGLDTMDVRCEKCQTEYELDEARLKPGGVTVKCTNCGHMFRIRKRMTTNVGPGGGREARDTDARARTSSSKPPFGNAAGNVALGALGKSRSEAMFEEEARQLGEEVPTTIDRQWLIRLENGEQKSCRELATLQQWIIAGVVTRESLISRTGKTWKRLGDLPNASWASACLSWRL
jgi:predicted Zn finger-like uncharacterized protein